MSELRKNLSELNPHFAARLSRLPSYELEIEIKRESEMDMVCLEKTAVL
jgi:hypothetical protein